MGKSWHQFQLHNENYVVISDYYSKFFEVSKLTNVRASMMIKQMKPHFARYGIWEEVISDNGPQFARVEFEKFIKTLTSNIPLHHHNSLDLMDLRSKLCRGPREY